MFYTLFPSTPLVSDAPYRLAFALFSYGFFQSFYKYIYASINASSYFPTFLIQKAMCYKSSTDCFFNIKMYLGDHFISAQREHLLDPIHRHSRYFITLITTNNAAVNNWFMCPLGLCSNIHGIHFQKGNLIEF